MERDPVQTNRSGYRPPSRMVELQQQYANASTPSPALAAGSGGVNGVNNREPGNGSYRPSSYNAAKRIKSNILHFSGSLVYRDGETTGFEEDGSETPGGGWVNASSRLTGIGAGKMGFTPLGNKSNALAGTAMRGHIEESSRHSGPAKKLVYTCLWRKPQVKKHKTWDNDGILVVSGGKATLRDKETSQIVGSGSLPPNTVLVRDQELTIGGKDVQIEEQIPERSYDEGSCFAGGGIASAAPALSTKVPAASAASFYGSAKSAKKFVPPSMTKQPVYSASKKFSNPASRNGSRPNLDDEDIEFIPPTPIAFPTAGYSKVGPSSKTAAAAAGLGRGPPVPKALHNPNAEGALVMTRPDEEHQKKWNAKNGYPVVDVLVDPGLASRLRDHQREGVKFMYEAVMGMKTEGQGCILADEMGLGKTIQSIALVYTLLKQSPYFGEKSVVHRVLIACPVSLVKNWQKEFQKWLGKDKIGVVGATGGKEDIRNFTRNPRNHVLVIGYEKLRTVIDEVKRIQPPVGLIICDEGHRLKSAGAKTTQALQSLNTARRIILSGTPIQNELSEFHAMVDFVNPGLLDSYNTFKKIFEQPILKAREPNAKEDAKLLGQARNEALNRMTARCILRRTSEVIANFLPPKAEYVVFIAPTQLQRDIYNAVLGSSQVRQVLNGAANGLQLITILKKVTNTPGILLRDKDAEKNGDLMEELRPLYPPGARLNDIGLSGKMLAVRALLQALKTETDEKIVLVSSYRQTLDVLEQLCVKHGFSYTRLDGETKQAQRQLIVDDFNRTSQQTRMVFLLSTKAGGTGLNIIGASRLVLFDSDWNPSTDLQAMARIHRDGQKRPCFIYRFLTTGTMDEKIYQRQITKTGLAGSLMNGGEGAKAGKGKDAFSISDLRDIFRFHGDTGCQTHDLLGCECRNGSIDVDFDLPELSPDASDIDSDSEHDQPRRAGFVVASQYSPPKEKQAKANKKLQMLKEWNHIDCDPSGGDATIDSIEDEVLKEIVSSGFQTLSLQASRQAHQRDHSLASDDPDLLEAGDVAEGRLSKKTRYTGGEISYIFHKRTANLGPASPAPE